MLRETPASEAIELVSVRCEIIIPSYNRLNRLFQTVRFVCGLYPDIALRLAIQGEAPSGDFAIFIDQHERIKVSHRVQPGVVDALNAAIQETDAEVILLLDDDALPCPGWLEGHVSGLLSSPDVAYTCGREVNVVQGRTAVSEILRITAEMSLGLFVPRSRRIGGRIIGWTTSAGMVFANFCLPGRAVINAPMEGNFAIRVDDFQQMNGFDARFKGNAWGYGLELGYRFARMGRNGLYVGDAIILHYPHPSGGSRNRRGRKWFKDYVHNNSILVRTIGPIAWLGAIPRLIKRGLQAFARA